MACENTEEITDATNQPLISQNSDSVEIEIECADKVRCHIEPSDHLETETQTVENGGEGSPKTSKAGVAASLSVGINHSTSQGAPVEHTMAKSQSEIQVCVTNSLSVSQTSKNSLMTFSSSGTFYDHTAAAKKKVDLRITPKRVQHSNGKDTTDFRQMEQGLLQLLEDFHSGKLEAFGQGCTFERMENVREQQERLARLHFDLNAQQELCGQHTEEGIMMAKRNLAKLTENLQELSLSIEKLQSGNPATQADV